jgi:hypothetical protein
LILLLAVITGLIAGGLRAWIAGRKLQVPNLRWLWLVPIAYLPQFFAFDFSGSRSRFPDAWIPTTLIVSQLLLLIFAAVNWHQVGFWLLGLGLALNLAVISLNGGWMPISPETIGLLAPNAAPGSWEIGKQLGTTKDKVIKQEDIRLEILSDRFVLPRQTNYRIVFSIGDALIAAGIIWFFWSLGGLKNRH